MSSRSNTIILTGGGSGGHITPVLSVAHALKAEAPHLKLVYIGQKGDPLASMLHEDPAFSQIHRVYAGKFRRFHGQGVKQLLDVPMQLKNLRDVIYTSIGLVQAIILLRRVNPKVVFCKGGFVGVPVGLASALLRIPYVTHDSDAIPGLANRLIGKWATLHAVALPAELYAYPLAKTVSVGVPIQAKFKFVTEKMKLAARTKLNIPATAKVLFIIGGGLGAQRINHAVINASKSLFKEVHGLFIVHVAGSASEYDVTEDYKKKLTPEQFARVKVYGFTSEVATLGEAANVVITRAGATNLAEFAMQGKACIIIPNPMLTGGHQPKNALAYKNRGAAVVLQESELKELTSTTVNLLTNLQKQAELGQSITQFASKDAALSMAHVLLAVTKKDA